MNDQFNTIAGWVLGGGIVLLGATLVTGEMFSDERPATMGYPIEGVVEEGGGADAEAEQPIAALLASADVARGANEFKKCATCHTITPGGPGGVGPNIHGIMGTAIAARGFAYSDALKGKGGTWTWEAMDEWLRSPATYAPGTKMTFAGLRSGQDRADLLLYLNSQGSSLALPPPPAAGAADPAAAPGAAGAPPAANTSAGAPPVEQTGNQTQSPGAPKGGGEARPEAVNPGGQ